MGRHWRALLMLVGAFTALAPQYVYSKSFFPFFSQKLASPNLNPTELPETGGGSSLLTVPETGRYSIRSKSSSGTNIELIDMIAGPISNSGGPGLRDGRVDTLLEAGTYKVKVHGAQGARGKIALHVDRFIEANSPIQKIQFSQLIKDKLSDLQQRSYSLEISSGQSIVIEVAGRSLKDVRLWRIDGSLVSFKFIERIAETKPGHPINSFRLEGELNPGSYIITAYGGESLLWSDGSKEEPFFVRLSEPKTLAAGVVIGKISPFGTEVVDAPSQYNAFRLELPQVAPVTISAQRNEVIQTENIDKTNRAPATIIKLPADDRTNGRIEINGYEGQAFKLEALRYSDQATYQLEGLYQVLLDLAGDGGDEISAAALFARLEQNGSYRVLASNTPKVGPGLSWRSKFNFTGPTSILFEVTQKGPIFLDIKGLKYRLNLAPALGSFIPRADGAVPLHYNLNPGFYLLSLEPEYGAGGIIDVSIGPPGAQSVAPQTTPSRSFISLGEHKLDKAGSYILLSNVGPNLLTGPRVFTMPITIDKGSFSLRQEAEKETTINVQIPTNTRLIAMSDAGERINYSIASEKAEIWRNLTIKIPPSSVERTIGLMTVPEITVNANSQQLETTKQLNVTPGKPAFADFDLNETKYFHITVPEGGLYRVETLGRLHTSLKFGSAVSRELGSAEENGPGKNAQLSIFLRAGSYYAEVTTKETSGHLGLSVSRLQLLTSAQVKNEGLVSSALSPEKGLVVPLEITKSGDYELRLAGLNREWKARIEDSDGWPIKPPGLMTRDTTKFETGIYRLVISPEAVEGRVVAKFQQIKPLPLLEGHGPHELSFASVAKLQWREPADKNADRTPDQWHFKLYGDSEINLTISQGMIAELMNEKKEILGKATQDKPLTINLAAGGYKIHSQSLAHDDRVDYEIGLTSPQLQPEAIQNIILPGTLDFSLDKAQIVDLSSFSNREVLATLKTQSGSIIERIANSSDNWNLSFSKHLPAGKYKLEIEELNANKVSQGGSSNEENADNDEVEENFYPEIENGGNKKIVPQETQIRLSIIEENTQAPLPADGKISLQGSGAHNVKIETVSAGNLSIISAQSAFETGLSLERQDAESSEWRQIGYARGLSPTLAFPASQEKTNLRILAWTIGNTAAPILLTKQDADLSSSRLGKVSLQPVKNASGQLCIGKVDVLDNALLNIVSPLPLFIGSSLGSPLRPITKGAYAPQSNAVWLMSQGKCDKPLTISSAEVGDNEVYLDLEENEKVQLPSFPEQRDLSRIIIAHSAFAQPRIETGKGSAISSGLAVAIAGQQPIKIWRSDASGPMRFSIKTTNLKNLTPIQSGLNFNGIIPPKSAQLIEIPEGQKQLSVDLTRGLAVFIGQRGLYAKDSSQSRVFHNAGENILIVNPTETALSAQIIRLPENSLSLDHATFFKRFIGMSGEISLPIIGQKDDWLKVAGANATIFTDSGQVLRGNEFKLENNGEAIIHHKSGLVAAWIERQGAAPWPKGETKEINLPQQITLQGDTLRFTLNQKTSGLLNIKSDAPALVSFSQKDKHDISAFASGIDFHHYIAEGDATIEIISPNAGPLSGTANISAQPYINAKEGINEPVVISSGASVLFSVDVSNDVEIGFGLRSDPDQITAKLLDTNGTIIGEGVSQKVKLKPGRYFIEARSSADAGTTTVRLNLFGLSSPPATPPSEAITELLDKIGMKKQPKK